MNNAWPVVPGEDPGAPRSNRDRLCLSIYSMFPTTFVGLVGQGYAPREAFAMAIVVCVGGAEIIRRFRDGGDDGQRHPRWA